MLKQRLGDIKFYKVKNPKKKFFCALCKSPRELRYQRTLSSRNHFQLTVLIVCLAWPSYEMLGPRSLFVLPIVYMIAEVANKILYRKNLPCPFCGFDATWYRRDVTVARKKVLDFMEKNYPQHGTKTEAISEEALSQ